jgi:hypothetical protein
MPEDFSPKALPRRVVLVAAPNPRHCPEAAPRPRQESEQQTAD